VTTNALRPHRRAVDCGAHHRWRSFGRRAHVEHHLDHGTELPLHIDGTFGREAMGAAVVDRAEHGAVVVDLGANEKIWYPPESVRMCPSQSVK
jgi:hypothetical protein